MYEGLVTGLRWMLAILACCMSHVSFLMSHVSCLVSHVACLVSHVSCRMSHVACLVSGLDACHPCLENDGKLVYKRERCVRASRTLILSFVDEATELLVANDTAVRDRDS